MTARPASGVPAAERPVQDGSVPGDPFALLRDWLPANGDPDRPLCTLATVDDDGRPDARTVLVSAVRPDGVAIHTDATSRKVRQLDRTPFAAVVMRWPEVARQVVLRGGAQRASAAEDALAYAERSRYLRLLAHLNSADLAVRDRAERERAFAAFDAAWPDPQQPPSWVGYAIVADEITFWEGAERGPSRRARYSRAAAGWAVEFLPG